MKKQIFLMAVFCLSFFVGMSQNTENLLIGDEAVSFTGESTQGEINFPEDFGNKWKILLSHPKAFTPVCSSEILELANMESEFEELDAAIVILSTNELHLHKSWIESMETLDYHGMGQQKINFPMVADEDKKISQKYGMIHPETSTEMSVRGVFIISPDNIVRYVSYYPMEVGRNMNEIKRTLIALQTAKENIATPANWEPGNDVMLSAMTVEQEEELKNPGSDIYQIVWYMTFMKR